MDLSAPSHESGRNALQLAVDSDSSIQRIALVLGEEGKYHREACDSVGYEAPSEAPSGQPYHTALEVAAGAGDLDAVRRLLAAGADPNAEVHRDGVSALEAAAAQGRLAVVQKLLEKGADPDHTHHSRGNSTPLAAAATAGHMEICEALLESGADVSKAIKFTGKDLSITLLEMFLGILEGTTPKDFDAGQLVAAVAEGREEDSQRLLRTKGFLHHARTNTDDALRAVAAMGDMPLLQWLLDAGAIITGPELIFPDSIAAAASAGQLETMNKLLQAASDRGILREEAVTAALQSAVDAGHVGMIEPLLQGGADFTRIDIRRAAAAGDVDLVASILQHGAPVESEDLPDDFGKRAEDITALHLAAHRGHEAVVDLLLAGGADVQRWGADYWGEFGGTPLHFAAAGGHIAVAEKLVSAGADVNTAREDFDTPLQAAVRAGSADVVELLLSAGADVDAVGSELYLGRPQDMTALSIAAALGRPDTVVRLLPLMSPGCAARAVPFALHHAVVNQHVDVVRGLLRQTRPDVNQRRLEETAVHLEDLTHLQEAAVSGNLEVLEMLLAAGADANLNRTGGWKQTALQAASERGDLEAAELLLAAGARVNVTGSTAPPLLLAVRGGHVQLAARLLAAGADIHATAYGGQTVLEAADENGSAEVVDMVRHALDSTPAPLVQQPPDLGTGPLCEACRQAPLGELYGSSSASFGLHPSLAALRASAAAGCPFCCFLWKRVGVRSTSIPQPSPVRLHQMADKCEISCDVEEPFSDGFDGLERIDVEFPFFRPMSYFHQRIPITEDTSSPESYKQIHTWLETCRNEHPKCRARPLGDPSLPTRLIYIDTTDTGLRPRLVSTDDMEWSECRYLALSYRWAQYVPPEAKLSRDNIQEQMRGLDTLKLPQAFNDFFQIAIEMGISHVWIDSLCIVQDDPDDWAHEAALMIQIYRYAEFSVAAAVPTTTPELGLFRHGDPSDVPSVTISGIQVEEDPKDDNETGSKGAVVVIMKPQKDAYRDSPLCSRGWCFQEREISQRVVHYTDTQVLWECRTLRASESLPGGVLPTNEEQDWAPRMLDAEELSGYGVLEAWQLAVEDYSARDLTVPADKLPALSGLAATVREFKPPGCRYLAGLWEDTLMLDLCWYSRSLDGVSVTNARYDLQYVAPTWSWASVRGPVVYTPTPSSQELFLESSGHRPGPYDLRVLDVSVQTATRDPFGAITRAVLTCAAGVLPGVLGKRTEFRDGAHSEIKAPDGKDIGYIHLDADGERNHDGADLEVVFCVQFGPSALALVPTGNKDNEYKRVGIIPFVKERDAFQGITVTEITII